MNWREYLELVDSAHCHNFAIYSTIKKDEWIKRAIEGGMPPSMAEEAWESFWTKKK